MKFSTFLRPFNILITVVMVQLVLYLCYIYKIIPSFRIEYLSTNVLGYINLFTFYFVLLVLLFLNRRKKAIDIDFEVTNEKLLFNASLLLSAFSIIYVAFGFREVISTYSLLEIILKGQKGIFLHFREQGTGLSVIFLLAILSNFILILLLKKKKKVKYRALLAINFLFVLLLSNLLMSRIIFIQTVVFTGLFYIRVNNLLNHRIRSLYLLIPPTVFLFLIYTSGVRDYDVMGHLYTGSKWLWGLTRIADYFISTMNYTLEALSSTGFQMTFPARTFGLLTYFTDMQKGNYININKELLGNVEYTNLGSFVFIYSDYYMIFPVFMIMLAIIYNYTWNGYLSGNLFLSMLYCVLFYNLLETTRIFYIGSVEGNLLVVLLIFLYFFLNRYIQFKKE